MIQRSSKGVMLRFFFLSYLHDTRIEYLCRPSPSLFHNTYALPLPFPLLQVLSLSAAFSYSSYLHAAYPFLHVSLFTQPVSLVYKL